VAGLPPAGRPPVDAAPRFARLALGAALAAVVAGAAVGAARRAEAHGSHGKLVRGVVTYQRFCARCHGASGRGDGPRAAEQLLRPVDLTRLAALHGEFDRRRVAASIDGESRATAHGEAELPVWGDATLRVPAGEAPLPAPLDELLDYLEHLQSRDGLK